MNGIMVGVDESPSAAIALRWALEESGRRRCPVTAVMAWTFLEQHRGDGTDVIRPSYHEGDAEAALERIVTKAIPDAIDRVGRRVVCDGAARALLDTSAQSDLLVLGARGLGGFRGLLLGSVSQQCVHHSRVPVAVVRTSGGVHPEREHIVVGIDGSRTATGALGWALDEARLRRAKLTVVHAWRPAVFASIEYAAPVMDPASLEAAAKETVEESVALADTSGLTEAVETRTVEGGAARAILDAATGASLIVVGSRGRGGFAGLLLGSVSQHVVTHAHGTVVVVPDAVRTVATE